MLPLTQLTAFLGANAFHFRLPGNVFWVCSYWTHCNSSWPWRYTRWIWATERNWTFGALFVPTSWIWNHTVVQEMITIKVRFFWTFSARMGMFLICLVLVMSMKAFHLPRELVSFPIIHKIFAIHDNKTCSIVPPKSTFLHSKIVWCNGMPFNIHC